jgi:hypothetical protein
MGERHILGALFNYQVEGEASVTRMTGVLDGLKKKTKEMALEVAGDTDKLNTFAIALGTAALASEYASRKINAAVKSSVQEAQKYQLEMANLRYAVSLSDKDYEETHKRMLEYGQKGIFSAKDYAEAMYNLASAGMTAKRSLDGVTYTTGELALQATTDLVNISRGHINLQQASEFTVAVTNKLGLSFNNLSKDGNRVVTELDRVMDKIAAASRLTAIKPEEMPTILNSLRSAMTISGSTIEETLAMVGMLRNVGDTAAEAGQHVNELVRTMSQMGGKWLQADLYQGMSGRGSGGRGFPKNIFQGKFAYDDRTATQGSNMRGARLTHWMKEVFGTKEEFDAAIKDKQGNFVGMVDFFGTISDKMKAKGYGSADESFLMLKLLGNSSSQATMKKLMDNAKVEIEDTLTVGNRVFEKGVYTGFDAIRILTEQIRKSEGEARKYSETMLKTSSMIEKVKEAAMKTFATALGVSLLPFLDRFNQVVTGIVNFFTWVMELPIIGPVIAVFIALLGGMFFIGAKVLGIFIMGAFAVSKYRAGLKSLIVVGLQYIETAGMSASAVGVETAAVNANTAAVRANMAIKDQAGIFSAVKGIGGVAAEASAVKKVAPYAVEAGVGVAGIIASQGKAMLALAWVQSKLIILWGWIVSIGTGIAHVIGTVASFAMRIFKPLAIFITIATVAILGLKWATYDYLETTDAKIKEKVGFWTRQFTKLKVLLSVLFTGGADVEDMQTIGQEGVEDIYNTLNSGFMLMLRNIITAGQEIGKLISGIWDLFDDDPKKKKTREKMKELFGKIVEDFADRMYYKLQAIRDFLLGSTGGYATLAGGIAGLILGGPLGSILGALIVGGIVNAFGSVRWYDAWLALVDMLRRFAIWIFSYVPVIGEGIANKMRNSDEKTLSSEKQAEMARILNKDGNTTGTYVAPRKRSFQEELQTTMASATPVEGSNKKVYEFNMSSDVDKELHDKLERAISEWARKNNVQYKIKQAGVKTTEGWGS